MHINIVSWKFIRCQYYLIHWPFSSMTRHPTRKRRFHTTTPTDSDISIINALHLRIRGIIIGFSSAHRLSCICAHAEKTTWDPLMKIVAHWRSTEGHPVRGPPRQISFVFYITRFELLRACVWMKCVNEEFSL